MMGFRLAEVSHEVGVEHTHHTVKAIPSYKNIAKWLESIGAGVTIADFNNDGFMDIILNDNQPSFGHRLFINNGHGKFLDKTDEFKLNQNANVKIKPESLLWIVITTDFKIYLSLRTAQFF